LKKKIKNILYLIINTKESSYEYFFKTIIMFLSFLTLNLYTENLNVFDVNLNIEKIDNSNYITVVSNKRKSFSKENSLIIYYKNEKKFF